MICSKCGFKFSAGGTCPSCGHVNTTSDSEHIARENVKEYPDPKPQKWVVTLSIFGILVNTVLAINYLTSLNDFKVRHSSDFLLAMIILLQVAINVLMIVSFINLIRMRKWALWVIRITYILSTLLVVINGNLLSAQFAVSVLLTLVFWFGNWLDYT